MKNIFARIESLAVWVSIFLLFLVWLPIMAVIRLIERDEVHYYTGRFFRLLGKTVSRINPRWNISYSLQPELNDRAPYVVISNHLSNADIPLISNVPWEMKWTAKKELFDIPFIGWMMRMAGDISVDRKALSRRANTLKQAEFYLKRNCSVIFFPEGTRSRTGKLGRFTSGAFELAVSTDTAIVPIVVDGTQEALPRTSWVLNKDCDIRLKVLPSIPTHNLTQDDVPELVDQVRGEILKQLAEWRNNQSHDNDELYQRSKGESAGLKK